MRDLWSGECWTWQRTLTSKSTPFHFSNRLTTLQEIEIVGHILLSNLTSCFSAPPCDESGIPYYHSHPHVEGLPYLLTYYARKYFPVSTWSGVCPKRLSWFVDVRRTIEILQCGNRVGVFIALLTTTPNNNPETDALSSSWWSRLLRSRLLFNELETLHLFFHGEHAAKSPCYGDVKFFSRVKNIDSLRN